MHSIRTKSTLLTVSAIIAAMTVATLFGVYAIRSIGTDNAKQMLLLLCETGEKNLDAYFESVEQSVETVSSFVHEDLRSTSEDQLDAHMDRARVIFAKAATKTNGVLTYYYRIDPSVSETVKGFWFTNLDGEGFAEHEVTDITLYDTQDTSKLIWFTVPKATGKPIWLPPYITDNLDVRVISYNVPIYWNNRFIGVVGIEIDYSTMADQVDHIKLFDNGYAFINDEQGNIIYHPRMDVAGLSDDERPKVPEGLIEDDLIVRYTYDGAEKQAVWLPLSNGMRLNVSVPISEINSSWRHLLHEMLIASAILLAAFILLTMYLTGHITKPLRKLAEMAVQVNAGNYDVRSDYEKNDEIGILSGAFNQLTSHLKVYINDLNDLAYADALTSVHNKGAFDIFLRQMRVKVRESDGQEAFAVGIFDCDNLKQINDRFGHDKGDIYLQKASALICRVFQHSPVFRTGGDEFAVVLQHDDYNIRDALIRSFEEQSASASAAANEQWEQTNIAFGFAVFDPQTDRSVDDVVRRADKLMYENKKKRKVSRRTEEN